MFDWALPEPSIKAKQTISHNIKDTRDRSIWKNREVPHQTLLTWLLNMGEFWSFGEVFSQLHPNLSRDQLPFCLQNTERSYSSSNKEQ